MAGYDDTNIIAQVRDLLVANPTMSRRSAIIAVAGEPNLRRIEIKMRRLEAEAPLALDAERRGVVAAEHATRYPLRLKTGYIEAVFVAAHPEDEAGNGACSVGFLGEHLFASVAPTPEATVTTLGPDYLEMPRMIAGLATLGFVATEEGAAWPYAGGPCHRSLSMALAASWRAAGLGGHLDDAALLSEAAAFEEARFAQAGFEQVASRFPAGFALAMSRVAEALKGNGSDLAGAGTLSRWLRLVPGAAGFAVALGPLSGILIRSRRQDRFDDRESTCENLWTMLRTNCLDAETGITPGDVAWCLDQFGGAIDAPLLTDDAVFDLVAEREWIDALGPLGAPDRAALATMVACTEADGLGNRDREGLFEILRTLVPGLGGAALLRETLATAAAARDMSFAKALKALRVDFLALRNSLCRHVVSDTRRVLPGLVEKDFDPDDFLTRRAMDRAMDAARFKDAAAASILQGRDMAGVVALVLDWVAAGRPGYASERRASLKGRHPYETKAHEGEQAQRDALFDFVMGPGSSAKWRRFFELLAEPAGDAAGEGDAEDTAFRGGPDGTCDPDGIVRGGSYEPSSSDRPLESVSLPWWRRPGRFASRLMGRHAA